MESSAKPFTLYSFRNEDQDPLATDSGDDEEESIGPPFLFLHDPANDPQIQISNIEGNVEWKTEDIEAFADIDAIIEAEKRDEEDAAAATESDHNIQRGTRSILFPDNPPPSPKEHKIKSTADPKIKLEPNLVRTKDHKTKKPPRSKGTADPRIKVEPNLRLVRDIKKERPTISKDAAEPKMNQIDESRKKSDDLHICAVCMRSFDHQVKLSAHINMAHSKVKVGKDEMFECPYPNCNYK